MVKLHKKTKHNFLTKAGIKKSALNPHPKMLL
jgi:hypothetical protein